MSRIRLIDSNNRQFRKRTAIKLLRLRRTKIAGNMTAGSKALWRYCLNIAGNVIKTRRYWCAETIGRFTFKIVLQQYA